MRTSNLAFVSAICLAVVFGNATTVLAACSLRDVAGRAWAINATEVKTGILTRCRVQVDGSGKMVNGTNACKMNTIGIDNFDSSKSKSFTAGSIRSLGACDFRFSIKIDGGTPAMDGVVSLSSDKLTALGVFQNDARGGGYVAMVRQ